MGVPGFAGLKLEPTPDGVLADLPGGHHGRQKAERRRRQHSLPRRQRDGGAAAGALADARRRARQDAGGRRRRARGLREARRAGQTARIRLNSTVVNVRHDGDPASAREVVVTYSRGRQALRRARRARGHGVLEHVHPVPGARPAGDAEGGAALRRQGAARLHQRGAAQLDAPSRSWASPTSATPTMYHDSWGWPRRSDLGDLHHRADAGRADGAAHGPAPVRAGQAAQGAASDRPRRSAGDHVRDLRAQHPRSAGPHARRRRLRPGARHRRDHRQPLAARLRLHLQQPDRPDRSGCSPRAPSGRASKARQPFGLITIANSDAAASPHTDAAFLEARRAVGEVLERRAYPFVAKSTKTDA